MAEEEGWGWGAFWIAGIAIDELRKISMTTLQLDSCGQWHGMLRALDWI